MCGYSSQTSFWFEHLEKIFNGSKGGKMVDIKVFNSNVEKVVQSKMIDFSKCWTKYWKNTK